MRGRDRPGLRRVRSAQLFEAFHIFDNQSIEQSLSDDNLLVRILALLDRRLGKRRLKAMARDMAEGPGVLRRFYSIRLEAEGLNTGKVAVPVEIRDLYDREGHPTGETALRGHTHS